MENTSKNTIPTIIPTPISSSISPIITQEDLALLNSKKGLVKLIEHKKPHLKKIIKELKYEEELALLQIELVKLQQWAIENQQRVAILFEGRDAAGKGSTILRFTQNLRPRQMRVVALPKPTDIEKGQWYFQRYIKQLPNPGEIVFFDRSWYNRAVVEPVMGFCNETQYKQFMLNVNDFEHMLHEDGLILIKFWFAISKEEQAKRFKDRKDNPLKQWKISPIDEVAQKKWNEFTKYKDVMLNQTHTTFSPWIIVEANDKRKARLESIRYVLSQINYGGKEEAKVSFLYDPEVIISYNRTYKQVDR
jgi:polyphosphate kinase